MNQTVANVPRSDDEEHMLGHGFYNKHSHEQGKANTYGLPLIVEAINQIDLRQIRDEFRIADYGSAQGQNSRLPMKTAIAQIKTVAAKSGRTAIPISVTHTDLPTNDWTTLFQTVLFSPDSYLTGESDIFCFASGTSIYQQIFPPNHIAFGYSAITEHWLSRKPCNIPNEIWSARDRKGPRHLGGASQSRLARVCAISRAGNATIGATSHHCQRRGRGRQQRR